MPAARFWRVVGIGTYGGGDLELSELHLYSAGSRVDGPAMLTSTIAPASGSLAALQDGNLATACRFAAAAVRSSGFALVWDFGAGIAQDVSAVRLGAGALRAEFADCLDVHFSSDGRVWASAGPVRSLAWPGSFLMQAMPSDGDVYKSQTVLSLHFDGANGSTLFTDRTGKTVTTYGNAKIDTALAKIGYSSGVFDGGGDGLSVPNSADFSFGSGDFTVELIVQPAGITPWGVFVGKRTSIAVVAPFVILFDGSWSGAVRAYASTSGSSWDALLASSTVLQVGNWYHIALVRYSGTLSLYINGVLSASGAITGALMSNTSAVFVGMDVDAANSLNGRINFLRVIKGAAVYTDNFTPPSDQFPDDLLGGVVSAPAALRTAAIASQVAASAGVPSHGARRAAGLQLARDVEFGGNGRLWGTTKAKGTPNVPTRSRVMLLRQRDKALARETWSDAATGAFEFRDIDTRQAWLVLAEDAAGGFRPVAASQLVAEVQA